MFWGRHTLLEDRAGHDRQAEGNPGLELVSLVQGDEDRSRILAFLRRGHNVPENLFPLSAVGVDRDIAPVVTDSQAGVDVPARGKIGTGEMLDR